MSKNIIVIGSGFSSLSASCYLRKEGHQVTVLEKLPSSGGRARQLERDGFYFDMGPTFYWMPDVFESFFQDFGKSASDYYELNRLDPGYEIYFGKDDSVKIHEDIEKTKQGFEEIEKGASKKFDKFLALSEDNYEIAIQDLVYQPAQNIMEIVTPKTAMKLGQFVSTIRSQAKKVSDDSRLQQVIEFPSLFLGAKPSDTPGFYNFMNYADLKLGTWHPTGGMYSVSQGIRKLAEDLGVEFKYNSGVDKINTEDGKVVSVTCNGTSYDCDVLLSGADYAHTETLIDTKYRQYDEAYWNKKTFAPSALMFYVGFDKKLSNLSHHTLFFDESFDKHAHSIYDNPEWPKAPLFYSSFPSMTDKTVAPDGKEAGIFLIPIAPDLEDTPELREKYFKIIIERLEDLSKQDVQNSILFKESYCVKDFKEDYNSFKGNAYGMANTLFQTHVLRPRLKSKKLKNMFFTGQLTVPGPGVPPSLISGKIVSDLINKIN